MLLYSGSGSASSTIATITLLTYRKNLLVPPISINSTAISYTVVVSVELSLDCPTKRPSSTRISPMPVHNGTGIAELSSSPSAFFITL